AAPRPGFARDLARAPSRSAARPRTPGDAERLGVPGPRLDLCAMGCSLKRGPPRRAEVVGSLLRPASLRYAVEEFYSGGHSAVLADERARDRTELRALEDEAIRDAARAQIDLGLDGSPW